MNTITLDNGKQVELEITRKGSWINFVSNEELSENEALEAQMKAGYHPGGYGFYSFKGKTWACATSCD